LKIVCIHPSMQVRDITRNHQLYFLYFMAISPRLIFG
jgi:hypothetical protein